MMGKQPSANEPVSAQNPTRPAKESAAKGTAPAQKTATAVAAATATTPPAAIPPAAKPVPGAAAAAAPPKAVPVGGAAQPADGAGEAPPDEPGGFGAAVGGLMRSTPSWLTSMVVHIVILLVMGLMTYPRQVKETLASLVANASEDAEEIEDIPVEDLQEIPEMDESQMADIVEAVEESTEPVGIPDEEPVLAASTAVDLEPIGEVQRLSEDIMASAGTAAAGDLATQRGDAGRKAAVASRGGSAGSEEAVALALEWLAKHQNPDGSWNFDHRIGPCGGRCDHPGTMKEARFAATGMGLLPFLGAGQTHKQGKYKDNVKAGLAYLITNGKGGSFYEGGGAMYGHGICTIALTEAYGMTQDKHLFGPAQAAVDFICNAQDPVGGGWRYAPKQAGDTSVVGWQIMALKSAHLAYLNVPPNVIEGAKNFLNTVQADSGAAYGYDRPGNGQATTAIGLLCRMHLGWKRDNPALARGVETLGTIGPSAAPGSANMYYNYYATQVLHHYEGEQWVKWNEKMRDFLVNSQSKQGHSKGSWYFTGDIGSDIGGRMYNTAMATITLEVYYRHQPLYRKAATDDLFDE
jgi:hypothetical protein